MVTMPHLGHLKLTAFSSGGMSLLQLEHILTGAASNITIFTFVASAVASFIHLYACRIALQTELYTVLGQIKSVL